ncbi:hypothetical protein BG262_05160 [Floricoccus penangensis]|uniref:Uncharacterized protein n=2 Tax=Floricoccus penangensis TaxID=1859475 RepID=A0A9Q5JFQ7_9LACT|nr:hypothetical protein BG262_05160 [Floricoccus penangensis]
MAILFIFSMIGNIEITGTESKKVDLNNLKLQDGVKKINSDESVKPLTDVFSPVSENEKQTTDFYVNQKGKNFILSNGYELETKNLTELGKSETIKVEPFDGSYGGTKYFFSAYSDNGLNDIYLGYTSYLNNNIANSYGIQNGGNSKLYNIFPAKKFNGYEVACIYIMDIQDNYSINHINKIYRLTNGSGFYIDCSFMFDSDVESETNEEGSLYEFDMKNFDHVKEVIDSQFNFKETN